MQTAQILSAWTTEALGVSVGLLVARLVLGLLMTAHGSQKLFGWFGGYGIDGTGGFFEQIGFRPGRLFALMAGLAEFVSGILVAVGLLGPIGPALMVSVMIVAGISVHWKKGLLGANGIELTLIYTAGALALALTGPGVFSLDALLGLTSLWTPAFVWAALAVGIVGGIGNLAARRPAPALVEATQ